MINVGETTDQVRTKKWWLHVVADELHTYLLASHTHARSAPDEAGVLGDFSGVMVHDPLAMHFTYDRATLRSALHTCSATSRWSGHVGTRPGRAR